MAIMRRHCPRPAQPPIISVSLCTIWGWAGGCTLCPNNNNKLSRATLKTLTKLILMRTEKNGFKQKNIFVVF